MGGLPLNCPLCCNNTFSSKQSLLDHLTNASENVYCPVCNYKCSSLSHLVEHLSRDNCQPANNVHAITYERQSDQDKIENTSVIGNSEIKVYQNEIHNTDGTQFTTEQSYEAQAESNDANKMYVELFSKELKPCLQTREFKLVKENGESRYMIVTQDNADLTAGNTIVTKQNIDGTISLTTVKDMNMESENLITPDNIQETQEETQAESQEEIYSCNTCKVSFSSVIEHIQIYHSDQEVVVEEPAGEGQTQTVLPIEYEAMDSEDTLATSDKQAPRRVITDTGDIVEEPLMYKSEDQMLAPDPLSINQTREPSKPGGPKLRVVTQRLLQMDKLCDSVIKEAIQADAKDKSGPYHKVVVKEVVTDGGFAIKMYQCLACDISVTNLDEFKIHPCKKLKYPCLYCPVAYDNSKSLCAHMKAHKVRTDPITGPITYECSVCCTVFPTNKSLKLHKRMHDPVKSRPIEPPVENTDGSEVSEGRYRCTVCNKMIPNDYKTIHQNSHKSSEKMNCAICNKKFTSLEYLEMHTNVHNVDKAPLNNQDKNLPYSCLYCNRRFARPHEKVKHERIHTGEKPHSCEICGKSFRVSYCLTLHMRTHTGARPYACPHCGKRFKAHSVYNHHLLTHSEVRAYKCPFCPKAFKTSVQLAGHKNSHTKPFACQHCNRPFASLYAVRVHTETHARQNNLKFSCELCGASYARAFALKDHIKQAHSDVKDQSAQSPSQPIDGNDDWMIKANEDTDGIQALDKDLTHEMDLGMSANELIVP